VALRAAFCAKLLEIDKLLSDAKISKKRGLQAVSCAKPRKFKQIVAFRGSSRRLGVA